MNGDTGGTTPASSESIQDVIKAVNEAKRLLDQLDSELEQQIAAIDDAAFKRGRKADKPPIYEPAETAQRKRLRGFQGELADCVAVLAAFALQRLSESSEVAKLRNQMQTITVGLKDALGQLQTIAQFADTVAKVTNAVTDVATKLATLATAAA